MVLVPQGQLESQLLLITNILTPFSWQQLLREEGTGVKLPVDCQVLVQNSSHPYIRRTYLNDELLIRVGQLEDGSRDERGLEHLEGLIHSCRSLKGHFGRREGRKGGDKGDVVANEAMIEVDKPQEPLHLLARVRDWQRRDSRYLGRIHLHTALHHDMPQEGDGRGVKLTLLSLNDERVLQEMLQDGIDVVDMFLVGLGEDKYVIQVDKPIAI